MGASLITKNTHYLGILLILMGGLGCKVEEPESNTSEKASPLAPSVKVAPIVVPPENAVLPEAVKPPPRSELETIAAQTNPDKDGAEKPKRDTSCRSDSDCIVSHRGDDICCRGCTQYAASTKYEEQALAYCQGRVAQCKPKKCVPTEFAEAVCEKGQCVLNYDVKSDILD